jgi:hypothetical protein
MGALTIPTWLVQWWVGGITLIVICVIAAWRVGRV